MFWKNAGATSQINELLSKEDCTLDEILDEGEVLQETTGGNRTLLEYLLRKENFTRLVSYIVTEPPADKPEAARFKFANVAAEILSSDVQEIRQSLSNDRTSLAMLCDFFDQEGELNPLLASFVSKVFGNLVAKKMDQQWISYEMTCLILLEYLKSRGNFVARLQAHLNTSAVMDLLLKFISQVEGIDLRQSMQEWLISEKLVENLLILLKPSNESAAIANAAQVLCDAIRILRDQHVQTVEENKEQIDGSRRIEPLLSRIQSEDVISSIIDNIFEPSPSEHSIVHGIQVLLVLMETRKPPPDSASTEPYFQSTSRETVKAVVKRLNLFHQVLLNPPKKRPVRTPSAFLEVPFGAARLSVCRLIATLIDLVDLEAHAKLVELQTLNVLLDLLVQYSQNNFLHAQVERSITSVFKNAPPVKSAPEEDVGFQTTEEIINSHPLLCHVLRDCRLVDRILEEFEESSSDSTKQRKGYMGHLASIANSINEIFPQSINAIRILRVMDTLPEETISKWKLFTTVTLARINKENELTPIEIVTANANEEEAAESLKAVQRQNEEAALQMEFLAYQASSLTHKFENKIGYSPTSFGDEDDQCSTPPETLVTISLPEDSEELMRRQKLFEDACDEKIDRFGDDEIWADRGELGFTSPGKASTGEGARCRFSNTSRASSSSSDEDSDQEVENVRMEVDSTDPWSSFSVRQTQPSQLDNPWDSQSRDATAFGDSENWANFDSVDFGESKFDSVNSDTKSNSMDCSEYVAGGDGKKTNEFVTNFEGNFDWNSARAGPAVENAEKEESSVNGPVEQLTVAR